MGMFSSIQYISEDKNKYTVISRGLLYFLIFKISVCVMSSFHSLYLYHVYPIYIFVKSFFFYYILYELCEYCTLSTFSILIDLLP